MRRIELQSALISRAGLRVLTLLHENNAELVLHLGNLPGVGKGQSGILHTLGPGQAGVEPRVWR